MTTSSVAFEATFAGRPLSLHVPEANLAGAIDFTELPPLPDIHGAAIAAFESPIGCRPLSSLVNASTRVAILTGDRMTDRILGARDGLGLTILKHLNDCGVPDRNVTLIYACGMHPHGNADEKIGHALPGRVRWVKHEARDANTLAYVGVTSRGTPVWVNRYVAEADLVLGVGEVSPVMFGGFCGGGKIVLPGAAGSDTIEHHHRYMMAPLVTPGLVAGNWLRDDIEEAADLAGLTMKLDMLVNGDERVVQFYAGDFRQEWRAALPLAREIWMTRVPRADIHIFSPGESREQYLGSSLYLSMDAAYLATRDDGIAIALISAVQGWAPGEAIKGDSIDTSEALKQSLEKLASRLVRKDGNVRSLSMTYNNKRLLSQRRYFLVSPAISDEEAREYGFACAIPTFDEALARALAEKGQDATITLNLPRGIRWRQMIWRE